MAQLLYEVGPSSALYLLLSLDLISAQYMGPVVMVPPLLSKYFCRSFLLVVSWSSNVQRRITLSYGYAYTNPGLPAQYSTR
ncbi:hypothetical protein V8F06_011553 [Rhypophila decipiens]